MEFMTPVDKYMISGVHRIRIGSLDENEIVVRSPEMIGVQAEFAENENGWSICDTGSRSLTVNGNPVQSGYKLKCGDILELDALRIIYCVQFIGVLIRNHLKDGIIVNLPYMDPERLQYADVQEKDKFFHRSPRNTKEPVIESVTIENPPAKQQIEKKPLLMVIGPTFTMMIPMMLGGVLAMYSYRSSGSNSGMLMYTGLITAAASAAIGVLWAFINMHYDKKRNAQGELDRRSGYARYLRRQIKQIAYNQNTIKNVLGDMYKSPDVITQYTDQSTELWNRNRNQKDYLVERVGLGTLDVSEYITVPKIRMEQSDDELIQIPGKVKAVYSRIKDVPQGVDLGATGIIGIVGAGDKSKAFDVARTMIAQIAANNSYRDVKLAFAFDSGTDSSEWMNYRFMPHVWLDDYSERLMASDRSSVDDLFFRIIDILRDREQKDYSIDKRQLPHIVLFVADTSLLEGHAINKYITTDAQKYSFTVVTLADKESQLLNDTIYELMIDKQFSGIHKMKTDEYSHVDFDKVTESQLADFADRIAVIKVNEDVEAGGIPDSLTFFDMLGIQRLEELRVLDRWKTNKNYNSMRAVIGQSAGGKDCILDVHEKYHGPHGLVAGTTGSGKSETLQTYILSMAINYSPDDIGFFIIDYKGGGMANLFDDLPHMIGAISNLSGSAIKRAMVSIKSENMRRQRVFNEAGVNNINNYTKLVKAGEVELPVPHLFIIVDEFAELKREQPEFMKELISVAQVGRSLGVHLILSTQKPAGTVDENIWSNSKFKLCLRVQDKQDSKEMLHKEDAAFITQAGRGYLQVGNDEVYELFQSGWSGAEYLGDADIGQDSQIAILSYSGMAAYRKKREKQTISVHKTTQLEAVIMFLAQTAAEHGYDRDYSLWMEPLRNPIYIEDIERECPKSMDRELGIIATVGMCDDPAAQKQFPFNINISSIGNLAVCGTNVSGKSTFLQTLIYSLITKYSSSELNLYIADFSNKSLMCYENAPHVGGVVCDEDEDRIKKMIYLIERIMSDRKKMLGGISFAAYNQGSSQKIPAIILIIDNYAGFREKTNEIYDAFFNMLTHDGAAYGIYIVMTASGFGSSAIPSRIENNISETVALRMNERYQYSSVLRIGRIELEPENLKGRGLVKIEDNVLEFQTALAVKAENEFDRIEAIRAMCNMLSANNVCEIAEQIPEIPDKPTWELFKERTDVKKMLMSGSLLPLGYDRVSAEAYGIELKNTFCYLIAGQARTGKKNLMKILVQAAAERDSDIVVIEHGTSEFRNIAIDTGARYIEDEKSQADYFCELLPDFVERNKYKNMLKDQGYESNELYEKMLCFKETFIFISDIEAFMETIYHPSSDVTRIAPFVENVMEKGAYHNIFIIALNGTESTSVCRAYKAYDSMVGYHVGIQMGGRASENTFLNFSNISFSEQNKPYKAGVGMISQDNDERDTSYVIIPLYRRYRDDKDNSASASHGERD